MKKHEVIDYKHLVKCPYLNVKIGSYECERCEYFIGKIGVKQIECIYKHKTKDNQ